MKVLVTGCGGDIGQSIGKILNSWSRISDLHGIDISDKNAAKFIFPNFQLGPRVDSSEYIFFCKDYIQRHEIDLVIPIAEPELRQYELKNWDQNTLGVHVLMANKLAMQVGFDKLGTSLFLSERGFPFPKTQLLDELNEPLNYPVILKSRTGSGSKSIVKVKADYELDFYRKLYFNKEFIVQEYIPSNEGEYTCGLFRSGDGEVRSILFRRELTGGFSGYGEIVDSDEISKLLNDLAVKLELRGAINVQLRLQKGIPFVFEINPRFSSTVYFRHQFGFDDLKWSILDLIGEPIPDYSLKSDITKFYKGFTEYVD